MSIQAKLYIEGEAPINVLECNFAFKRPTDEVGVPLGPSLLKGVNLLLEATKGHLFWEWATLPMECKQAELHFVPHILGGSSRILLLIDVYCVGYQVYFNNNTPIPITEKVALTCGGFRDTSSVEEYSTHWRQTFPFPEGVEETVLHREEEEKPIISVIEWNCDKTNTKTKETTYGKSVFLTAMITNPSGNAVQVAITKKDGTAFTNGKMEISLSGTLDNDGYVAFSKLQIEEEWEDTKQADIDELIAQIKHGGVSKKSKTLKIVPKPKVIVEFRPNKDWKGEFGFDWIRKGDTKLFGDNKYEDIVSKHYKDAAYKILETDGNEYEGNFKKDEKLFKALKGEYEKFTLPWSKKDKNGKQIPEDYSIPWMSLLKDEEVELNIIAEIIEKADYIEFDENENFEITPCKIDISGKQKIEYKDGVTIKIKCKQEFSKDQTLIINACKKSVETPIEAGKIQVWANHKAKQKEKKVVFVQIKTPPVSKKFELTSNASLEKKRVNKYLKQALISLHNDSDIVTLDLTKKDKDDDDLEVSKFITSNNSIHYENDKDAEQLEDFLKAKLKTDFKDKYKDYFKAFYFAEAGGEEGGLSGYSMPSEEYVVVFNSANDQTASHEFLHALNLAHSFANKEADKNATYTYQYAKTDNLLDYSHHISKNSRCGLWYWQWVKANNSI